MPPGDRKQPAPDKLFLVRVQNHPGLLFHQAADEFELVDRRRHFEGPLRTYFATIGTSSS